MIALHFRTIFRNSTLLLVLCLTATGAIAEENPQMTRELAHFIVTMDESDIPDEVYEHAKLALLDWMGVTVAGSNEPLVQILLKYSEFVGGNEQSSVLGHRRKTSVTHAALINGSSSHAHDFDDSHEVFRGHPSASIFASLFALAELENTSGKDLLTAYIIGLHTAIAVAECNGKEIYMKGLHNTSILGIIASAAASARLMGLNEEQTLNAISIATTQAFGLKRSFGTMCKPFHAGHAAEGAVVAVLLARDGFTGSHDILEGPNGLFEALGGAVKEEALSNLGKEWGIKKLAVKYHASCHWTHSPIDAVLAIQSENSLNYQDIESIEISVSEIALKTAGIQQPENGLQGKFSIPYTAVNALVTGKTGIPAFTDDAVKNQEIVALISKTTVRITEQPTDFTATAIIKTKDGKTYTADVDVMKEFPGVSEKTEKVKKKFNEIVIPILGEEKTSAFTNAILALEDMDNINQLLDIARK